MFEHILRNPFVHVDTDGDYGPLPGLGLIGRHMHDSAHLRGENPT